MGNRTEFETWWGPAVQHRIEEPERYDRLMAPFQDRVLATAGLRPGERVLDVGCGTGTLTREAARAVGPDGEVVGLDVAGPLLERARRHGAGAPGAPGDRAVTASAPIRYVKADAQTHPFEPAVFDAVISRFGVLCFEDPVEAFTNLARALKPGGRMAFSCWRDLLANEWLLVPVAAIVGHVPWPLALGHPDEPGPFALAEPDRLRAVLADAGLTAAALRAGEAAVPLGSTVTDVVAFLRRSPLHARFLGGADATTVERAWAAVTAAVAGRARTGDEGVALTGSAWLVTATRPPRPAPASRAATSTLRGT